MIVTSEESLEDAVRINAACRAAGTAFVYAPTPGCFGAVFCDFGSSFTVNDTNGEEPIVRLLERVEADADGTVRVHQEARHGLEVGSVVTFAEVLGMPALNDAKEPRRVTKVIDGHTFCISSTEGLGEHQQAGGYVTEVKQSQTVAFQPLDESLASPVFVASDFVKEARLPGTHALLRGLEEFRASSGRYPAPWHREEAQAAIELAQKAAAAGKDDDAPAAACFASPEASRAADTDLAAAMALQLPVDAALRLAGASSAALGPMCSVIGAIAAAEALKAVSGKFSPIQQWMYIEASEALPPLSAFESKADFAPRGDRYDGQRAAFGSGLQDWLARSSWFVVGAGAIGCEALKTMALMGVAAPLPGMLEEAPGAQSAAASSSSSAAAAAVAAASKTAGRLVVTDMDTIEKSNLSRQFLFRPRDVGKAKSTVAAAAVKAINPRLVVEARETRVGADTEDVFDEALWRSLDGVCTALDNVQARLYVDLKCVQFGKVMLESGTLGAKGNTQVVLPGKTENYGATSDPAEQGIPVCTLKNFPNKIEHTLQWARDWFEGEFKQAPDAFNAFLKDPAYLASIAGAPNRLELLLRIEGVAAQRAKAAASAEAASASSGGSSGGRFDACAEWARDQFEALFVAPIKQLLHSFPSGTLNDDGSPFWSGQKRCPSVFEFDEKDPLHREFIATASVLRAAVIDAERGRVSAPSDALLAELAGVAGRVRVAEFVPTDKKIAKDDAELKAMQERGEDGGVVTGGTAAGAVAAASGDSYGPDEVQARLPARGDLRHAECGAIDFEKDDKLHMRLVAAASNLRARSYAIQEADIHRSKLIAGKIIPAIATTTALVVGLVGLEMYKVVQSQLAQEQALVLSSGSNSGSIGCRMEDKPLTAYRDAFLNLALPLLTMSEPVACTSTIVKLPAGAAFVPANASGSASAAPVDTTKAREWKWSLWDEVVIQGPMSLQVSS